jgi:hypothetical protein
MDNIRMSQSNSIHWCNKHTVLWLMLSSADKHRVCKRERERDISNNCAARRTGLTSATHELCNSYTCKMHVSDLCKTICWMRV